VNFGKEFPPVSRIVQAPGKRSHPLEQKPHEKRLSSDLRKDSFVEEIEKLRDADKERDAMTLKCLDDALR
jgi:hypothetical protein